MGRPPPIIRAMPERKRFFFIDVFPNPGEVKGVYEIIVQQDENFKYPDVQVASHG